jgi:hypothetical protein
VSAEPKARNHARGRTRRPRSALREGMAPQHPNRLWWAPESKARGASGCRNAGTWPPPPRPGWPGVRGDSSAALSSASRGTAPWMQPQRMCALCRACLCITRQGTSIVETGRGSCSRQRTQRWRTGQESHPRVAQLACPVRGELGSALRLRPLAGFQRARAGGSKAPLWGKTAKSTDSGGGPRPPEHASGEDSKSGVLIGPGAGEGYRARSSPRGGQAGSNRVMSRHRLVGRPDRHVRPTTNSEA